MTWQNLRMDVATAIPDVVSPLWRTTEGLTKANVGVKVKTTNRSFTCTVLADTEAYMNLVSPAFISRCNINPCCIPLSQVPHAGSWGQPIWAKTTTVELTHASQSTTVKVFLDPKYPLLNNVVLLNEETSMELGIIPRPLPFDGVDIDTMDQD